MTARMAASPMSETTNSVLDRFYLRIPIAFVAAVVALLLHMAMEKCLGLVVPLFITFYPAVIVVAVTVGFWPGLLTTALSALAVEYWLVAPRRDFGVANTSEAAALAFFFCMGLFMCSLAEHYRRNMVKLAALYKNEYLLHNALLQSEKLAVLGRMAATIAHEINNPLAAAMNSVFLAETSAERPESVREYLTLADQELRLISHITRQVLGFYRESAKPSSVSIGAIMDESLDIFKSKIKAKQATVEKQYGLGPQITAVPGEVRQVFSNILANSLDAIEEHGTIKVRISSSQREVAHGGTVRITVADNGKGIEAAVKPRIFEPMFTTKGDIGTGLGLWVSRQIITKHKGSIRVHSSTKGENRGTAFSIVLPFSSNGLEVNLKLRSFDSAGPARHRNQKTMKASSNGEASVRGG